MDSSRDYFAAVDHRNARNDGGVARRIALDDRRRVGPEPAFGVSMAGLGQTAGQWMIAAATFATLAGFAWALRSLRAGRAIYAVDPVPKRRVWPGSNRDLSSSQSSF